MWADMALAGLQSGISSVGQFILGSMEAKAKRKWQKYNNQMVAIANAQNQNSITTNEILATERASIQKFNIDRSEIITSGQAEASAAAADTEGRSVNAVIFDVERNAGMQRAQVQSDLEAQYLQFSQQRKNSAFQMAQQQDHSFIPMPNPVTALLNFGATATDKYQRMTAPVKGI